LDEILDELDEIKDENRNLRRENNFLKEENEQQLVDLKHLLSINQQMEEHLTMKPEGILSGTLLGSEYGQHERIHNLSSNLYTGESSKRIGTSKPSRQWGSYSTMNDIDPEGGMSGFGIKLSNSFSTKFPTMRSIDGHSHHQQLWGNVGDNIYKSQTHDIPSYQGDIRVTDSSIRFNSGKKKESREYRHDPYIEPVD
jgi:hypothetical protein